MMRAKEILPEKASAKLCKSRKKLGSSDQASCVSQGLRPHKTKKKFHGQPLDGKTMASKMYGGPIRPGNKKK